MADAGFLTVFIAGVVQCSVVLTRIGFFDDNLSLTTNLGRVYSLYPGIQIEISRS